MELFDTHAHLDDERFDEDRDAVLERMGEHGISRCVLVGADMPSSRRVFALAQEHEGLYCAVGVHPHDAKNILESDYDEMRAMLAHPKAVAWGEIGLDYHYDYSPRDIQRQVFERQLVAAVKLDVPVILHIREAHGDMLSILRAQQKLPRCVAHCYSGSWETAKEYLDLGLFISFAGALTFKNAAKLPQVAQNVPLGRLLIETDCPYLSPEPLRGRRNEPANVRFVAQRLGEIRGISQEELRQALWSNSLAFYGLKG